MKELMKNKGYLTLMIAQAISSVGDWLSIVAIITLVGLKWNATPMEVSLIFLCLALPMALFGPIAGAVADRFSRKTLMVLSDIVRSGLILILSIADALWMVYICLLMVGVFSTIFIPAKNGKLKELVSDEHMKAAMSISSMIDSSTKVMGPLLSGLLVAVFGAKLVFYIDSATFFISALFILFLPKTVHVVKMNTDKTNKKASFREEFSIGFSFIKGNSFILIGMFFLGVSLLLVQLADSQLIVLIRELTAASPDLFAYLLTASGVGMFLCGLYLARKAHYHAFSFMLIGVLGLGIGFGTLVTFTYFDMVLSIIWVPLFGFIIGFSASLVFVPFHAAVQVDTPVHLSGRVFGVINSVATTATMTGPLFGGWLSTVIGVIPAFIISSTLLIVLFFIGASIKNKIKTKPELEIG